MIDNLNDPSVLDDTPIGTLRVVEWGGTFCVAIMHQHDTARVRRVIHQLEPGENPLNAVYGKRTLEQPAVRRAYDAAVERRERGDESFRRDHSKDFRKELRAFLGKRWDGDAREAVIRTFTRPK